MRSAQLGKAREIVLFAGSSDTRQKCTNFVSDAEDFQEAPTASSVIRWLSLKHSSFPSMRRFAARLIILSTRQMSRLPRLKIKHRLDRAMLRLLAPHHKRLLILIEPEAVRNQSCWVEPLLCHQPQIDLHGVR